MSTAGWPITGNSQVYGIFCTSASKIDLYAEQQYVLLVSKNFYSILPLLI